jgi:hypothetical protein
MNNNDTNNYPTAQAYPVNDDVEAAPAHGAVTGTHGPVTSQPKPHGPQPGDRVIIQDNGRAGGATDRNGRPHTWVILSVISMIFCWYVVSQLHRIQSLRSSSSAMSTLNELLAHHNLLLLTVSTMCHNVQLASGTCGHDSILHVTERA